MPKVKKRPRYLYKYLKSDIYAADILCNGKLYFNIAEKFNDPFDIKPVLRTDYTEESWRNAIRGQIEEERPEYSEAQLSTELQERFNNLYPPSSSDLVSFETRYRTRLEKVGIFAASERSDSIIMWSHYVKDHTGLCLKLDTEQLPEGTNCLHIKYSNDRPIINLFSDRKSANVVAAATKTADWKYEAEWRIVKEARPDQKQFPQRVDCPKGFIKAVIFGAFIDPDERDMLLDFIKHMQPIPIIEEAYLDDLKYKIRRRPFME